MANNGGTAQAVGDGTPIGVPVRIIAINNGSGTVSTFYNFAQSGIGTPGRRRAVHRLRRRSRAASRATMSSVNAASGPDPDANQGPPGSNFVQNPEVSLENDANQIGDFANANWPNDPADEATDIATSLYSMSFGVFGVNPNASTATIETGTIPAGDPTSFAAKPMNGQRCDEQHRQGAGEHVPDGPDAVQHLPDGHGQGVDGRIPRLVL